ncbi:MAG TPA: hypothetical protein VG737_01245 [Cyclobacteriaceae bacterium]|nr:hypothetical protein [Cyclobacteriaceae bacterium]
MQPTLINKEEYAAGGLRVVAGRVLLFFYLAVAGIPVAHGYFHDIIHCAKDADLAAFSGHRFVAASEEGSGTICSFCAHAHSPSQLPAETSFIASLTAWLSVPAADGGEPAFSESRILTRGPPVL